MRMLCLAAGGMLLALACCSALQAATLTVTSAADTGTGSLRTTLASAGSGDVIVFDSSVTSITLASVISINNNVTISGPGVSALTISGGNTTALFAIAGGSVTIQDLTLSNASATQGSGLSVTAGTATIQRCRLNACNSNTTAFDGGAIRNGGGTLTVRDCLIENCANIATGGGGGGIWLTIGTATIERTTIRACSGSRAVGIGIVGSHGSTTIRFCAIYNNTSSDTRASVYGQTAGPHVLENCTIVNNVATNNWGGFYPISGTWTVRNNTITGNSQQDMLPQASATVSNNAIGNIVSGTVSSGGFNVVGNRGTSAGWQASDVTGTAATPVNLLLGTLANNGGPTQTMLPQTGSPLLNLVTGASPDLDQRGLIRSGTTDAGAVEVGGIGPYSVSPASVPIGGSFTLTGEQMNQITAVSVGGTAATLGAVTATSLTVTVAAGTPQGPGQTIQVTAAGKNQAWLFIEVTALPPEIEIFDAATGGTSLTDPASVTGVGVTAGGTVLTFRIENQASAPGTLAMPSNPVSSTITAGSGAINVSVTQPSVLSLAPGASTTFTVTITSTASATGGAYAVEIDVASNDGDENPFDINISGTASFNNSPRANNGTSSPTFTGTADTGPFGFSADPNATVASQIVVDDLDADDVQVVSVTPAGAQAGITPAMSTGGFAQVVTVDFTGTIDPAAAPGVYSWVLSVQDDQTPPGTRSVTVNITVNNVAPVGVNQAIAPTGGTGVDLANAYTRTFSQTTTVTATDLFSVTDANTGQTPSIISQTRTGGTSATTFPFNGMFTIAGAAGSFTVSTSTASALVGTDVGTHEYTLVIEDTSGGNQITVFVILTVTAQTPPVFTPATPGISIGQGATQTGVSVGTVSDAQDSPAVLAVSATTTPAGISVSAIAVNPTTGAVTATISASFAAATGAQAIQFTVTDSGLLTDVDSYNFTVVANVAPVITAGSAVGIGLSTTLSNRVVATVSDGDQAAGTLTVAVLASPPGLTVSTPVNTGGTVTADLTTNASIAPGMYLISMQVTDNHGVAATTDLTVNVVTNVLGGGGGSGGGGGGCTSGAPVIPFAAALVLLVGILRRKRPAA